MHGNPPFCFGDVFLKKIDTKTWPNLGVQTMAFGYEKKLGVRPEEVAGETFVHSQCSWRIGYFETSEGPQYRFSGFSPYFAKCLCESQKNLHTTKEPKEPNKSNTTAQWRKTKKPAPWNEKRNRLRCDVPHQQGGALRPPGEAEAACSADNECGGLYDKDCRGQWLGSRGEGRFMERRKRTPS